MASAGTGHRVALRPARGHVRERLVVDDRDSLARVLEDAAHYPGGFARGVASPTSEAEVAALFALGIPLLPIGAQSSLTGGATPRGEVVVSTVHLADCRVATDRVTVGAGLPLDEVQRVLAERGRWYPPVPTYTAACAGGVVATNAAGPATFKHGPTRPWVRALTVVLPSGRVLDVERGQVTAHPDGFFEFVSGGTVDRIPIPRVALPRVPKCSAGYAGAPGMDLVDLFVGSEGTLGIVTEITFATATAPPATFGAMIPVPDEGLAWRVVERLRAASRHTWATGDPNGIDVASIEHLDARSIALARADGADARARLVLEPTTAVVLFAEFEAARPLTPEAAWRQVEDALGEGGADGPVTRLCRLLADAHVLDATELALPGDLARRDQFRAVRESVPEAVNRRVALARAADPRVSKTAADVIVPVDRFEALMRACRAGFEARGLDYAVWGHVSDGNVHPNVIPRGFDDVVAGREAVLELGRAAIALGGSPLAEHGVGRNAVKQELLRLLHGEAGLASMLAVKRAIDPDGRLAPGVLFPGGSAAPA